MPRRGSVGGVTTHDDFRRELQQRAADAGFFRVGIAPPRLPDAHRARLDAWLGGGLHGSMAYMARPGVDRTDASTVLPGARSVIVFAARHAAPRPAVPADATPPGMVLVARYALGRDYHDVFRERLRPVVAWLDAAHPGHAWRVVTDSAPLLERAFAERAGIGFAGRNTLLIAPRAGSYLLLAEIVTTAPLTPDAPVAGTCGTCTRCIDACPTGAITQPWVVDARRCISHTTIELRGEPAPEELAAIAPWAFGCDVCQEVCPYNGNPHEPEIGDFAEGVVVRHREPVDTFLAPESNSLFERRFAGSPLLRPGRRRVRRNARAAARLRDDDPADGSG